ncbi:MAG: DUF393 domain-containing protein [Bacteroidetes bacterium]|nr:DUF393 domain-containing protein [Bacteroidota bacterium]
MIENKPIVFFDGLCNLCSSSVQTIIKYDAHNSFLFASLQGATATQYLTEFRQKNSQIDSIILYDNGEIFIKSRAALQIAKKLKFPLFLAYSFIIIPNFFRNIVYDWVGKNRYKWFGKKNECWLPTLELKQKFLP